MFVEEYEARDKRLSDAAQALLDWKDAGHPVSGGGGSTAATAIATGQLTATTSPQVVRAANASAKAVTITNASTKGGAAGTDAYLGVTGVSSSTGHYLPPGASVSISATAAIYAVTESGTCLLTYMEEA